MALYTQIRPARLNSGDKKLDKGFDDVRRALDQIYSVLGVSGNTLVIPGGLESYSTYTPSESPSSETSTPAAVITGDDLDTHKVDTSTHGVDEIAGMEDVIPMAIALGMP